MRWLPNLTSLTLKSSFAAPILIGRAGPSIRIKFVDFFTVPIRNIEMQSVGESSEGVVSCGLLDFLLCSVGELNPILGFCFPVFSRVIPGRISIWVKPVELGGSKSVVFCGGSTYKVFICIDTCTFPRGYQKSQIDAVLSTHHSFAPPTLPGLLRGRQTLARLLQIEVCLGIVVVDQESLATKPRNRSRVRRRTLLSRPNVWNSLVIYPLR
jgi:hypothetical protein